MTRRRGREPPRLGALRRDVGDLGHPVPADQGRGRGVPAGAGRLRPLRRSARRSCCPGRSPGVSSARRCGTGGRCCCSRVLEMAGPWFLLTFAEQSLSSSLTGLLVATVPFVAALAGRLLGEEDRLTPSGSSAWAWASSASSSCSGSTSAALPLLPLLAVAIVVVGYATGAAGGQPRALPEVSGVAASAVALTSRRWATRPSPSRSCTWWRRRRRGPCSPWSPSARSAPRSPSHCSSRSSARPVRSGRWSSPS